MYYSTDYFVEENEFYALDNPAVATGSGKTFGIVVNNSGASYNQIYKNKFHNLYIGGQAERNNGVKIDDLNVPMPGNFSMTGLTWLCNEFQYDIAGYDLRLENGNMNYFQGYATGATTELEAKRKAARNKFSLVGESFGSGHDLMVSATSQEFQYAYIDAPGHKPDSYSANLIDINEVLFNGLPVTNDAAACPSLLSSKTKQQVLDELAMFKQGMEEKEALLNKGASEDLLKLIANGSKEQVLNGLLAASPYLSDEVLIAFIHSNPPSGHLKQIMVANSQLSETVKAELVNHVMPNGIANQIAARQIGMSGRTLLLNDLSYLRDNYSNMKNYQRREALLDESENANFDDLIAILKADGDFEAIKLLLETYMNIKDYTKIQETKSELVDFEPSVAFLEFLDIKEQILPKPSIVDALKEDVQLEEQLVNLKNYSPDKELKDKCACVLEMKTELTPVPNFLMESAGMILAETTKKAPIDLSRPVCLDMYPNPSQGFVTFDFPDLEDGELQVEVLDMTGKQVYASIFTSTNGQKVDLSMLSKGIYMVRVIMNDALIGYEELIIQ